MKNKNITDLKTPVPPVHPVQDEGEPARAPATGRPVSQVQGDPASPPPQPRTHDETCRAIVTELEGHHAQLKRLLALLVEAADDATARGRHGAVAELAKVGVSVQAGAARALAGLLSVETEGRLAAAALGRGGPRGPLLVSDADEV